MSSCTILGVGTQFRPLFKTWISWQDNWWSDMFKMLDTWLVHPSCSLSLIDDASAAGYCWQFVLSNQMKFQTVINRDTEWSWLGVDHYLLCGRFVAKLTSGKYISDLGNVLFFVVPISFLRLWKDVLLGSVLLLFRPKDRMIFSGCWGCK